jgi:hypothetical protein
MVEDALAACTNLKLANTGKAIKAIRAEECRAENTETTASLMQVATNPDSLNSKNQYKK